MRKSVVRNGADYASVEMQRKAIATTCSWRGWETEWFEDAEGHKSGRNEQGRPQWQRLKSKINNPDVVAVVGYRLDRFGRSVKDISAFMELCTKHGVGIVTADGQTDTLNKQTAWTTAQIYMTSVFAQLESDMARDRMLERVASKDLAGINHGKPPFGMVRIGEGNNARFVATDDIHAVIRCLELYAGGMSYDDVADRLNMDAVAFRSRHGAPTLWGRESVRTVVGNVLRYVGYHVPQTGYDAKANRVTLEGEGDFCEQWARALKAWISPAVDMTVERQLANAVIERRFKNQHTGRPAATLVFLLTPIAYWNTQKLRGQTRPEGRVYRSYPRLGGTISIDADRAENFLVSKLQGLTLTNEEREGVRQMVLARTNDTRMDAIRQRLAEAQSKRATLVDLLLSKMIDRETYNERYAECETTIRRCNAEIEMPAEVEMAMKHLHEIGSMIYEMSAEQKKRAIHSVFQHVGLDAQGEVVAVNWKPVARTLWRTIDFQRTNHAEGGSLRQSLYLTEAKLWFINLPQVTLV